VYRRGDVCKNIYIIYDGEFELAKTVALPKADENVAKNKTIFDTFLHNLDIQESVGG